MTLKFSTLNVKGLASVDKRLQVFEWLKLNKSSVYFLQEMHCTQQNLFKWSKEWGNTIYISGNSSNSKGVGILLNLNKSYSVNNYIEVVEGRLQLLDIEIDKKSFIFINIYGPNEDDVTFMNKLEDLINQYNDRTIILGGDFNTVIDYKLDKYNGKENTKRKSNQIINKIIDNCELNDIWRTKYPDIKRYTWHSNHRPPIF